MVRPSGTRFSRSSCVQNIGGGAPAALVQPTSNENVRKSSRDARRPFSVKVETSAVAPLCGASTRFGVHPDPETMKQFWPADSGHSGVGSPERAAIDLKHLPHP